MFFVYKPGKKEQIASESAPSNISEIYSTFTKDELEDEFQKSKYIAIREEEKIFDNLENEEAMRKFLTEFWRSRDYATNSPIGTSRLNYMRRIEYANSNFTSMGKPGWKSDRGRILLIYGEPDEYERFPSSMNLLPYIVWVYHNLEGGQQFVFSDLDGFGEYQLIHSTYRKELQNPDWQSMIRTSGGG
jgi:GWxTD domain-containing protein